MKRSRPYGVAGFALLTLASLFSLANPISRTVLTGSWHACVEAGTGLARLGIHFDILKQDPNCAMGSYAPGANFVPAGQVSIVVSLSALGSGLVLLFAALGAGRWLRATAHGALAWISDRLIWFAPTAVIVRPRSGLAQQSRLTDIRDAVLARPHTRRGPPRQLLAC